MRDSKQDKKVKGHETRMMMTRMITTITITMKMMTNEDDNRRR